MRVSSFSGMSSHRFSRRAPMGETVLSSTFSRLWPCSPLAGEQLQVSDGEFIHPEIVFSVDALKRGDMLQIGVFCIFQIMQYCACCDDTGFHSFDAKSFEGVGLEMFQQVSVAKASSKSQFSSV